jgi:transcription elongation GreA/GreB family factor
VEEDVEKIEPTSASIIKDSEGNLPELAEQLPSKFHQRFLDLITRVYSDDWRQIILERLLPHCTTKFSGESAHFLLDQGDEKLLLKSLVRWLDEQTIKGPVLLWILKFRKLAKFEEFLQPLFTPRLLSSVFSAIDHEALQNASTRRIPLAEVLSEDKTLIPDVLAKADLETAQDLVQALLLNPGFDDLSKRSLLARFIKLFPEVQELVDGSGESSSGSSTEVGVSDTLIVSKDSLDQRLTDLETITNEKIPENSVAIETAREHGDLRENAEYHMAKDEQKVLLARQAELQADLARAQSTDFSDAPSDSVGIGTIVNLVDQSSGEAQTYSILGAWDSDPDNSVLSYETPLGQKLLGKKVGEEVLTDIDGVSHSWRVEGLSRWVDRN